MNQLTTLVVNLFEAHVALYYRNIPLNELQRLIDQIDPPKKVFDYAGLERGLIGKIGLPPYDRLASIYGMAKAVHARNYAREILAETPLDTARRELRQARYSVGKTIERYAKAKEAVTSALNALRQEYPLDALAVL